jgi:hypothetical protein
MATPPWGSPAVAAELDAPPEDDSAADAELDAALLEDSELGAADDDDAAEVAEDAADDAADDADDADDAGVLDELPAELFELEQAVAPRARTLRAATPVMTLRSM